MCLLLSSDRSEGKCQPKCLSVSVYQSEAVQWPTTVPPSLPPSVRRKSDSEDWTLTHSLGAGARLSSPATDNHRSHGVTIHCHPGHNKWSPTQHYCTFIILML